METSQFATAAGPSTNAKLTPLMAQYWDVKSVHPDKIVLFRMGDFFEMFHRDAEIAAPVLGITLTSRNKKSADDTPMCGMPHHSVANAINKLLTSGFKIAICDQIEDPKLAKGLVKRAVTRILSPGVVYDPDTLDQTRANYIASFDDRSVSFLDATTGEAFYFLVKDARRQARLILNLCPVEVVVMKAEMAAAHKDLVITEHAQLRELSGLTMPESAQRLLAYAVHMQGETILEALQPFERREVLDRMDLPLTAIRHLELFETYKGERSGSLFAAVNRCKTSPGSRLLRSWLQFPLLQAEAIESRLDCVERWRGDLEGLKNVRSALSGLCDVQRRLAKLGSPSVNARDLVGLGESLRAGLEVSRLSPERAWSPELIATAARVAGEIERTIADEPPPVLKNGGVIRGGFNSELDELILLSQNSNDLILALEAKERELTGISSLKVRFNGVFGYYIEITNTHKDKVPTDRYDRKQTLANAERYLTPELADLERRVLSAQAKRIELETELFKNLIARCLREGRVLLTLATQWAEVDVTSALGWLALEQNYCRPKFVSGGGPRLRLRASRHPVIEQVLPHPFHANDIELGHGGCLLLTGPNMAGKSTLMRQVALTALLAQAGSFVPASDAQLPVFDRVFTRIGASDFLTEGLSTFMVEMKETAELLENATEDSLVVLDEIGRGTSTYDGLSLAQAILEYLLENRRSTTLFATHYHELTELAAAYPHLHCGHMRIHEQNGEITFLHQLAAGPANKSYGIHVAKLAGLPASVTRRAGSLLKRLEAGEKIETHQMSLLNQIDRDLDCDVKSHDDLEQRVTIAALPPEFAELKEELQQLEVGRMTPLEALNQIAKWQRNLS